MTSERSSLSVRSLGRQSERKPVEKTTFTEGWRLRKRRIAAARTSGSSVGVTDARSTLIRPVTAAATAEAAQSALATMVSA